jgi:hypothetical protein
MCNQGGSPIFTLHYELTSNLITDLYRLFT